MNLAKENIPNYVLVILVVRNIFIYKDLESGMLDDKSIKEYALPNARQWLGGRFVAIWVLPIYFFRKVAMFSASSAFVK